MFSLFTSDFDLGLASRKKFEKKKKKRIWRTEFKFWTRLFAFSHSANCLEKQIFSESMFDLVGFLWHINHWRLCNAKSLYIYIKFIWFGLVGFYGISTIGGYLIPNLLYTYIFNIYSLVWFAFYGISTIGGYLIPNLLYTYIFDIYNLVWFGFYGISTIGGYLIPNLLYTYIFNI